MGREQGELVDMVGSRGSPENMPCRPPTAGNLVVQGPPLLCSGIQYHVCTRAMLHVSTGCSQTMTERSRDTKVSQSRETQTPLTGDFGLRTTALPNPFRVRGGLGCFQLTFLLSFLHSGPVLLCSLIALLASPSFPPHLLL